MNLIGAQVEVLVKLPWYTEGPVQDKNGNIFFTTMKGGLILCIDNRGKISEWGKAACPNGQLIMPDGHHVVCDSQEHAVSLFDKNGKFKQFLVKDTCAGEKVNSPNDIVIDKQGGIYFTDSVRHNGNVFYVDSKGNQKLVASNLDFPNGITISADQQKLIVAESYRNRLIAIDIKSGNYEKYVFCNLPEHSEKNIIKNLPDGIKTDESGNIWVAHYGMSSLQVISPRGEFIKSVPVEFPLTSNLWLGEEMIIITGGYGEPGPGGLLQIAREKVSELNKNFN